MSDLRVIAIDGPAGSGKSTISRAVAERLGLATLDTGASYRAVTAAAIRAGLDPADLDGVAELADRATLSIDGAVIIDGSDVTEEIRSDRVNHAVSLVAANQRVRDALVAWQRGWVEAHGGGVVEGRDIGSVVFPGATVKLYLTASSEERARRRAEEGAASIERRDRIDSTRVASPLTLAEGAIEIDTTERSVASVVNLVLLLVDEAEGQLP
jgi:cytidylate kinase